MKDKQCGHYSITPAIHLQTHSTVVCAPRANFFLLPRQCAMLTDNPTNFAILPKSSEILSSQVFLRQSHCIIWCCHFTVLAAGWHDATAVRSQFSLKILQFCKCYDEGTLNDIIIERMEWSNCHMLKLYWAQNPQANSTDIESQTKSLLSFQEGPGIRSATSKTTFDQWKSSGRNYEVTAHQLTSWPRRKWFVCFVVHDIGQRHCQCYISKFQTDRSLQRSRHQVFRYLCLLLFSTSSKCVITQVTWH